MTTYQTSARVTLYANRIVFCLVLILLPGFPAVVDWYEDHIRPFAESERIALFCAFYTCALAALLALWHMDRLLGNILKASLFTIENISHIRCIRWCCLAVSLICLCASIGFPLLLFVAVIMAFLGLVITVVGQVMKAAVCLREENDLTI